jgi:elongator complex protein 3
MTHSEKSYTKEKPRKPVRSVSGVTPLTVVLKPRKCDHGTCIYCPGGDSVPQSYTDKSPAIMRALALKFDPYEQVQNRLKVLKKMGHPTDKIEIIVLGGTFLQYELEYQYDYIKKCFDSLNRKPSNSLEEAKKINETAEHRCVALCIENRPDNCSDEEIKRMLEFGCTRVEIGVQIPDDEIYKKINRGHTVQDVISATTRLKNAGFKVGYHYMPGLPHSTKEKDIELFKKLFDSKDFRPDQLKIYPCQIVEDSPLAKTHEILKYKPYTTEDTKDFLQKAIPLIPEYCRIMRIMREIPKEKMVDPENNKPIKLDIRKDIEENFKKQGIKINEIRMREIGFNKNFSENEELKLKKVEYNASKGKEYFLEITNSEDILYGLLRLRILPNIKNKKTAMVRELHVYGKALDLGEEGKISQHKGLGKKLMEEAEKIAKENSCEEIKVISGVGVREYYKKLGYNLDNEKIYMEKNIQ